MENGKVLCESKETKIIICQICNGVGTKFVRTSAYDDEERTCDYCGGYGRIKRIISTTLKQLCY